MILLTNCVVFVTKWVFFLQNVLCLLQNGYLQNGWVFLITTWVLHTKWIVFVTKWVLLTHWVVICVITKGVLIFEL